MTKKTIRKMAAMIRRIDRDLPEPVIFGDMSDEELVRRVTPLFRSLTKREIAA